MSEWNLDGFNGYHGMSCCGSNAHHMPHIVWSIIILLSIVNANSRYLIVDAFFPRFSSLFSFFVSRLLGFVSNCLWMITTKWNNEKEGLIFALRLSIFTFHRTQSLLLAPNKCVSFVLMRALISNYIQRAVCNRNGISLIIIITIVVIIGVCSFAIQTPTKQPNNWL